MQNQRTINTIVFIVISVIAITIMLLAFFLLSVLLLSFMERGGAYLIALFIGTIAPSVFIYAVAVRQLKKKGLINIKKSL